MLAIDVMSHPIRAVTPLTSVADAAALMRDHGIGFLPVIDKGFGGALLGVVTDRDVVVRGIAGHLGPDLFVRFVMSGPPIHTVRDTADVHQVLATMIRHQVRRVPVISSEGIVCGVISQGDLARLVGPLEPTSIEMLVERISVPPQLMIRPRGGQLIALR